MFNLFFVICYALVFVSQVSVGKEHSLNNHGEGSYSFARSKISSVSPFWNNRLLKDISRLFMWRNPVAKRRLPMAKKIPEPLPFELSPGKRFYKNPPFRRSYDPYREMNTYNWDEPKMTVPSQLTPPKQFKKIQIQRYKIDKDLDSSVERLPRFNAIVRSKQPVVARYPKLKSPKPERLYLQKQPVVEERGIIDNISRLTSNVLNRFLPNKKPSYIPSPPRRHAFIRPPQKYGPRLPVHHNKVDRSSIFLPSPKEGSGTEDAFQPVFVPSISMDEKFPQEAMKPMKIPQSRKSKEPPAPQIPEFVDFF